MNREAVRVSFSQQVKKEIMSRDLPRGCCAVAAAYAVACFGRYFDAKGIVLHTELSAVAHYCKKVLARAGIEARITEKGKEGTSLYELSVKDGEQVRRMLKLFGHSGEETALRLIGRNFCCDRCVAAFTATAFLCCGTMTNPEREYNLEFLSNRFHLLKDFDALLCAQGFSPKRTQRKGTNVLYFKASGQIEDILTYMGASNATLELINLKVYKDFRNKANRITNCETANIEKTVNANQNTLRAIAFLREHGALDALPEALREAAALRTEYPDISLKELSEKFDPPLSKSGLSHRLKKLEQTARRLREREANA